MEWTSCCFLTVSLGDDQVSLDNKTVDVGDAMVLQGLVAGVGQPGAGGPVAAEAAVALDLDEEADGKTRLRLRLRLGGAVTIAVQACGRAQAQDIAPPHAVAVAVRRAATDRGDVAAEPLLYGGGGLRIIIEQPNHRVARRDGGQDLAVDRPGVIPKKAARLLARQLMEDTWV